MNYNKRQFITDNVGRIGNIKAIARRKHFMYFPNAKYYWHKYNAPGPLIMTIAFWRFRLNFYRRDNIS